MCRNIKTLHNFKPPATDEEIRASSLQFVRKLSGFTSPSKANQLVFNRALDQVSRAAHELLDSLVTNAPPRDREVEAAKARARAAGGGSSEAPTHRCSAFATAIEAVGHRSRSTRPTRYPAFATARRASYDRY